MGDDEVAVRIRSRSDRPAFPTYIEVPVRVPIGLWRLGRALALGGAFALVVVLLVRPGTGLAICWKLVVPALPIVWLTMPGLWRNLCPLAAANQMPRALGFTRGARPPRIMTRFAYVVGITALFVLIPMRKVLFNRSGTATAVLLMTVLGLALLGGLIFKGKSGWCSTVCPLLPVQRLYGETPFVTVRNAHCEPCLGCAKNCYDFNPTVAKLADLDDNDQRFAAPRRFFAAAFPGLVIGFFSMPDVPEQSTAWVYGQIGLSVAVSIAVYTAVETFSSASAHQLTSLFAAAALNAFYWFNLPTLVDTIGSSPPDAVLTPLTWVGRISVVATTIPWLVRTFAKERHFVPRGVAVIAPAGLGAIREHATHDVAVTLEPGGHALSVVSGTSLLESIERSGLHIETGCRMGLCGADPVRILEGRSSLSPCGNDEASTLARLGWADDVRLACVAQVHGPCVVSLSPERASPAPLEPTPAGSPGAPRWRVVVIGNGVAGTTAAMRARELRPDCEIDIVGAEPHRLYNRMAITRLIHGRSAMQGLYLQHEAWSETYDVSCWMNTRARDIDVDARTVSLATGDVLGYDALILATGSTSATPDIAGFGLPGSFTLRQAEDAIAIRGYLQEHGVRHAIVAGGGVLGVEAAYALFKLGVETTLLAQSPSLMPRQLDEAGARLVERYLDTLGITVITGVAPRSVMGDGRVAGVALSERRSLEGGLFLACVGVVPDLELARLAGLNINHGVVVDVRMRTSDRNVYAAGDVAELDGVVAGLWPESAKQGDVAAQNAVGGEVEYRASVPTTLLKVGGIDVASIGRINGEPTVRLAMPASDEGRYRRIFAENGRAVGAVLVGHPGDVSTVQRAIEEGHDVSELLEELGDAPAR